MEEKLIVYCKYDLKFKYYIRDDGTIYSSISKRILKTQLDKDGYEKVRLMSKDGKRHRYSVHRLVLENFNPIQNMNNLQVNHIDGNKLNNNLNNLEWVTNQENITHAIKNKLRAKINGSAKLKPEQVQEIYVRANKGESNISLGTKYNVHPDTIGKNKKKKSWIQYTKNL